ncbi:hypothetical protein BDV41DRAFT_575796 [Aspergillus transmontanensis]|uniref:RRM domain-containing protein n=1 Tax=Aspergillus transmontanensis TaxID=1034304 RepID=A0A5N6W1W5_9EURO|nr:hypothetical protein BDV41DRAFT_575796 [Aspergillus transmontanensis]
MTSLTTIFSGSPILWVDLSLSILIQPTTTASMTLSRVRKCSHSAEDIAKLIDNHPAVKSVNFSTLVPAGHLYEPRKRKNEGYGFLLSIIFHNLEDATNLLDNLHLAKGPGLGTNL